jgi:predicted RNA polymerase sigma factor
MAIVEGTGAGCRISQGYLKLAEDILSETFLLAAETWGVRGMPPNPLSDSTRWLNRKRAINSEDVNCCKTKLFLS